MVILAGSLFYVFAHFMLYLIWGRNYAILRRERGIFLWHFLSFWLLGACCFLYAIYFAISNIFPMLLGALALHGIYSLSFLELWSLSQGGYSLGILKAAPFNTNEGSTAISTFEAIGDKKFYDRLFGLQNLGMLRCSDEKVQLTRSGKLAATLVLFIANIAHIKDRG